MMAEVVVSSSVCLPRSLPRMDYLPGDGGATTEAMLYMHTVPLAYVPAYGTGSLPAGGSGPIVRVWQAARFVSAAVGSHLLQGLYIKP